MLMGDLGWPVTPLAGGWYEVLHSGRSITGGLLGGFLAAEAAKPLVGYNAPPNDAFAAKLPFSIALGRIGCLFGGCCRGIPQAGPLSITYSDGVPRFPAQLAELVFQLAIGVTFVWMVRRRVLAGRVFALYLIVYGLFRFVTEPLRETPKPLAGLSVYQALAVSLAARSTVASKREVTT
jgi:prolipoprotein diacylglyceryltransferase